LSDSPNGCKSRLRWKLQQQGGEVKDKPKVGDIVFVRSNDTSSDAKETTVAKVGSKYFTVAIGTWRGPFEFSLDAIVPGYWKSSGRSRSYPICYRNDGALKAKLEADEIAAEARQLKDALVVAFDYWNREKYTLDQLRRIKAIVDESLSLPRSSAHLNSESTVIKVAGEKI
jgi:hypothetical protein